MTIRIPEPLKKGDLIAITAPSMGVPLALHSRLDRLITQLKQKGFRVIEGNCLRSAFKNTSADRQLRAKELSYFLTHPDVKMIMPPWGGELAMDILELIDFESLCYYKPKWFCGYSDLSTLHVPLTTISGWATLHGPNLMELAAEYLDITTEKYWQVLQTKSGEAIEQQSSMFYQVDERDWIQNPAQGFSLTKPTQWKRLDGKTCAVHFEGRLIGGCLETISRLAGTVFANIPKFVQQYLTDGIILYFESSELKPCELARALLSLKMQGWFANLNGILIGRSVMHRNQDSNQLNDLDAFRLALGHLNIPILYDVDIGHVPPQLSLLNGVIAQVSFHQNQSTIIQTIPALECKKIGD